MTKRLGFKFFLIFFLLTVFVHYQKWLKPDESLYLAVFDDPASRLSFYPWLVESTRQFRSGHFPLWSTLEGLGFPLLANYQSTPFNPFNLIYSIFPSIEILDWILLFKLILLGLFTYAFAQKLGLSALGSVLSALIISFSGYVSKNLNHITLNTELWLPISLIIVEKILFEKKSLWKFLLLAFFSAMAILGGNPESGFYYFLFLFLYCLFRAGYQRWREILLIALALSQGIILSSVQLVPFIEYLGFGWHLHSSQFHQISYAQPQISNAFSLFFPWIFGPLRAHPDQLSNLSYLGLLIVFLANFTLFKLNKTRNSFFFFWIYPLIFLGVIYRIPPFDYLNYLPIFNRTASVKYAYFGVGFSFALLAGAGLEMFSKNLIKFWQILASLIITSLIACITLILVYYFPISGSSLPVIKSAWILPLILLGIGFGVALYGIIFEEIKLSSLLLGFLCLINLLHLYPGLSPKGKIFPSNWQYYNPAYPSILEPIKKASRQAPIRYLALEKAFPPNYNLLYELNELQVFEGIYPLDYVRFLGKIEGFDISQAVEVFFKQGWSFNLSEKNLVHPWLNPLGVKYLVSRKQINVYPWQLIEQANGYYLYQNPDAWQRVWLKNSNGAIDQKSVQIQNYGSDRVLILSKSPAQAELVLADQYAPGWRAYLEQNQELKIFKEKGIFRKVLVIPGEHFIEFRYQPISFQLGLFSALVSWFSWILLLAIALDKRIDKNN